MRIVQTLRRAGNLDQVSVRVGYSEERELLAEFRPRWCH
jgi:hypothetical protein